ncbi:MAG TPA: hypothetical protein VKG91_05415 [Roseiarcus sp.]|nr:hypothetical protein [Roseiarcus sp.]
MFEIRRIANHVVHFERDGERVRIKLADPDLGADAFIDRRDEELLELHLRRRQDEGPTEVACVEARPARLGAIDVAEAEDGNGLNRGDDRRLQDLGVRPMLESQNAMEFVVIKPVDFE